MAIQTEARCLKSNTWSTPPTQDASPSAQPPKSECEHTARRLAAKTRWRPTFCAIVLASSSNMTRARSAAVRCTAIDADRKTLLLARVCLGLDCHEFSSAPSHDHWSVSPCATARPGRPRPHRGLSLFAGFSESLRPVTVHSVRAQRSRGDETDRSPAIGQRSYAQPLIPAAPAPIASSCSSSVAS